MNAHSSFLQYSARLKNKGVPLLGTLCFYSVGEMRIAYDQFTELLQDVGLDHVGPKEPRDDDVFRRVCTQAQQKRVSTNDPNVFENYLVRDVRRARNQVWKHVVVETVDASNRRLGYLPTHELAFDSVGSCIAIKPLTDQEHSQAHELAESIIREFRQERGCLNAYAIRETLRRSILSAYGIAVRESGGIYFVMDQYANTVDALTTLSERITNVQVHSVPLVDDEKQREFMKTAYEAATIGEIDATLAELDELLAGPPITSRRFAEIYETMQQVTARTTEYRTLLDNALDSTSIRIEAYRKSVQRLLGHCKVSKS